MEQIAVSFTDGWVPKTWLTPKVNIIDLWGKTLVEEWVCKELGLWWYIYTFDRYSPEKVYLYQFDWWEAIDNDFERYKFWGNELDAYSNKYSWGRTAAPYFTSVNWRFDNVDKAIKDAIKSRKEYDDKEIRKWLADIKKEIRWKGWYDVYKKLDGLGKVLEEVKKSVVDTSSSVDWNSSKNFSGINDKLDLMAEYVVKIKWDIDSQLSTLDEDVATRIQESNESINQGMSNRVTIEQLLQQVERLEAKLNEVVDAVVSKRLPRELTDKFDVNINRKPPMSDEEIASALGINQGLNEWMEEGMNEWLEGWLWEPRQQWVNAPVDMQWIAEPTMPTWY